MNIKDTIQATYRQWKLMNEGVRKRPAYDVTFIGGDDLGTCCHFCDFAGENESDSVYVANCSNCPALGLWSDDDTTLKRCIDEGSQYDVYLSEGDCEPMLGLIRKLADKNGVSLDEH